MVQGHRRRWFMAALLVAAVAPVGATAPIAVSAATAPCKVVNVRTGASTGKLQVALNAAAAGDTLRITGTCKGSFTVGSGYANGRRLALVKGATSATLAGTGGSVLKVVGGTIAVTGLRITGGDGIACPTAAGDPTFACGGGVWNGARLTLSKVTVTGNTLGGPGVTARDGGGIYNSDSGTLVLKGSTVSQNAAYAGGGIFNSGGSVTLIRSTVTGNTASSDDGSARGGGINSRGPLKLDRSRVSGNTASGALESTGGGIYTWGLDTITTILRSTVSGNTASGLAAVYGGGINVTDKATLKLTRSTVSGNQANDNGQGGGIASDATVTVLASTVSGNTAELQHGGLSTSSALTVISSTVTANSAPYVGGIAAGNAFVLDSSIVAGNDGTESGAENDCNANQAETTADHSIIGDGTFCGGITDGQDGNKVGTAVAPLDALLGPLAKNGGPTRTHALLAGSPAIKAGGKPCATAKDQRGVARPKPSGTACDSGAFERS
jgi:hypothetical protein